MSLPKVFITDFITDNLDVEQDILQGVAEVIALDAYAETEILGAVDEAAALMVYHSLSLSEASLATLKNCKLIVRCGVGTDNVDLIAARRFGIDVANVPDYGTEEVADSALAMTLALMRGTHLMNQRLQRDQGPWSYTQVAPLRRIRGQQFGIVGLGRIGIAAALRAKACGFKVAYYDPFIVEGMDKALGVRKVETLEELAASSQVLSLHCPLTAENNHFITQDLLSNMPRGSYVINTARGGLIAPGTIIPLLESGHLAGAGIDVLEQEPPAADHQMVSAWRDPNHPAYDRLILNPHAAFYCEEGLMEMRTKGTGNCRRVLEGKPALNVVNR